MPSSRAIGLWASGAFAAAALALPYVYGPADGGRYRVSAVYQGALAEQSFSPLRLQAIAVREDFAQTVGRDVVVDRPAGLARGVRIQAPGPSEAEARGALAKSVDLLQREMAAEAREQLETRIGYLRRSLEAIQAPDEAGPGAAGLSTAAIPEDQAHQAVRVQRQIADLQRYLQGGKLPPGLKALFRGPALRSLEGKLAAEQRQLEKLTQVYRSQRDILREQKALVRNVAAELRALERYEAESYLAALKKEQRGLEESAREVVAQNRGDFDRQLARKRTDPGPETLDGRWLPDELAKLERQQDSLSHDAKLVRVGAVEVLPPPSSSEYGRLALWLAALLALFWALRDAPGQRRRRPPSEGAEVQALPLPSPLKQAALSVASYRLSEQIQQGLVGAMGLLPSRLLVLGSDETELRASLSLHLARGLRASGHRVRLLDLDLRKKYLSRQLADPTLPGLADLMRHGGPVEEFLCSVDGPDLQFAPAGQGAVPEQGVGHPVMARLTEVRAREIVLIDASFDSPLHLVLPNIDAVLCLSRFPEPWTPQESEVLMALREAQVALWAVSTERPGFFPLI